MLITENLGKLRISHYPKKIPDNISAFDQTVRELDRLEFFKKA